jgi:hypothetical protein
MGDKEFLAVKVAADTIESIREIGIEDNIVSDGIIDPLYTEYTVNGRPDVGSVNVRENCACQAPGRVDPSGSVVVLSPNRIVYGIDENDNEAVPSWE